MGRFQQGGDYVFPVMMTIKELSKETGIFYDRIRKMCLNNEIVYIKSGTKFLVNADRFKDYLNGEDNAEYKKTTVHLEGS